MKQWNITESFTQPSDHLTLMTLRLKLNDILRAREENVSGRCLSKIYAKNLKKTAKYPSICRLKAVSGHYFN